MAWSRLREFSGSGDGGVREGFEEFIGQLRTVGRRHRRPLK
jgi:hypothetical protein